MNQDYFEKAPVPKAYFHFTMPVVFSMVLSLVYNMVDTYFIAQTGNTNLVAGVSLCAPVFTFMIALGDILGLGGSSVISRLFGRRLDGGGKRLSVFCFYGSFLGGIVIAAILLLLRQPILLLLGADTETLSYASRYYSYLALGAPFIIFSCAPTNLLRTEGFSSASMVGTVLGSVINMVLDPVFIFSLGMGATGAAVATVLGNLCADLFFCLVSSDEEQEAVRKPRWVSHFPFRTLPDFGHRPSGLCYQFYAEHRDCPDQPVPAGLWE
ncbi:MAG: polysaccharide biosynthesis C-terminal domain-containing protein [Clostridiales bacterium]|nr:polysaccharide biosynthesis C-terminal domain-containing protein [Clostridiales bacterium]